MAKTLLAWHFVGDTLRDGVAPRLPILSNRRELYHLAIKVSMPAASGEDQSHGLEHRIRQALEDIVGLEIRTIYVSRLPWPDEQP
jgi:hypothetical protein